MSRLFAAVSAVVIAWLLVVLGFTVLQRKLMYFPSGRIVTPAQAGLNGGVPEVLTTADDIRLTCWYVAAKPGQPTIIYYHGNGGSLADRVAKINQLTAAGLGVFMMSYRGFNGSAGLPSEAANVSDAKAAYEHVRAKGIAADTIVLFGESLGTGVATQVALAKPAEGLVLESPYTSVVDVGAMRFPWLPVRWALIDRYETMRTIGQVTMPVLVLHGDADQTIPVAMGRKVYEAVRAPKKLVIYPGGGHSDLWQFGAMQDVINWIHELKKRTAGP